MANPSNKKDGRAYFNKMNKPELVDKLVEANIKLNNANEEIDKLKSEIEKVTKKVSNIKVIRTDESLLKRVLELKAKNYPTVIIRDKLKLEGLDIEVNKINDMLKSELSTEMELYFAKCKKEYSEAINLNTNYFKDNSIMTYEYVLNTTMEDLDRTDPEDFKTRDSLRNTIINVSAKKDALIKTIDENNVNTEEDEALNETTENFKEASRSMIKLVVDNVKVIGG